MAGAVSAVKADGARTPNQPWNDRYDRDGVTAVAHEGGASSHGTRRVTAQRRPVSGRGFAHNVVEHLLLSECFMNRARRRGGVRRRGQDGFTIVELVVVAGLAGIVAAIAVPRVPRMVAVYDAANMASQIALDLRLARERAVTTNAKARLSFSTTAYQPQRESPAGSGTYISDGAQQNLANGITVTTNPSTPIFDSRGLTTQAYTLTITNAYGDSKTITVSVIGRINVS